MTRDEAEKMVKKFQRKYITLSNDDPELIETRAALIAALTATPGVPDGWKLVPVEPTKAMREAYHDAIESLEDVGGTAPDDPWDAMLAAAPPAPAANNDGEDGEWSFVSKQEQEIWLLLYEWHQGRASNDALRNALDEYTVGRGHEAPPAPAVSVAEDERYQWIDREEVNAYIKKQIAAERERCIKIINSMRIVRDGQSDGGVFLEMFKAETINAIRARAQGGAT